MSLGKTNWFITGDEGGELIKWNLETKELITKVLIETIYLV